MQILLNQSKTVQILSNLNNPTAINTIALSGKKRNNVPGVLVQVETDGLVVDIDVGDLLDDFLEESVVPSLGVRDHGEDGVIGLLRLDLLGGGNETTKKEKKKETKKKCKNEIKKSNQIKT